MSYIEGAKECQQVLADLQLYTGEIDGILGPMSDAAWEKLRLLAAREWRSQQVDGGVHPCVLSSFADPADIRGFKKCKAAGGTDKYCFGFGDNGEGYWGDDTTTAEPQCAFPPDTMIETWGSINAAHNEIVLVQYAGKVVKCRVTDRMPWRKNIMNGAGCDLNPGAQRALGLAPPFMKKGSWQLA